MLHGMLPSHLRLRSRQGSQACFARCRFCDGGLPSPPLPFVDPSAIERERERDLDVCVDKMSVGKHNTIGEVAVVSSGVRDTVRERGCSDWPGWTDERRDGQDQPSIP